MKNKIGIIADDFTGASDIGSFMTLSGAQTLLLNGIEKKPAINYELYDVIVIALKSRSSSKIEAISDTNHALKFLLEEGFNKIYFKYGSTFDSTEKGNIGPVADFLMEQLNEKYTVIVPSFPLNGRTVEEGRLYIDGIKIEDTHMRNHPANPMKDSNLVKLLENQSKYRAFNVNVEQLKLFSEDKNKLMEFLTQYNEYEHFYIIPDYYEENHGKLIANVFQHLKLFTGASVYGGWIYQVLTDKFTDKYPSSTNESDSSYDENIRESSIVLAGSLSKATQEQIIKFRKYNFPTYEIKSSTLAEGYVQEKNNIKEFIKNNAKLPLLVHSEQSLEESSVGKLIEDMLSDLAVFAIEQNIKNIVVAGGETSGAVVQKLEATAFEISNSISPGVPILIPQEKQIKYNIVLKSGNFGDDNFFMRALKMMGDLQ